GPRRTYSGEVPINFPSEVENLIWTNRSGLLRKWWNCSIWHPKNTAGNALGKITPIPYWVDISKVPGSPNTTAPIICNTPLLVPNGMGMETVSIPAIIRWDRTPTHRTIHFPTNQGDI